MATFDLSVPEQPGGYRGPTTGPGGGDFGSEPPLGVVNLRDVLALLRRNLALIVTVTAVVSALGAALALRQQPKFRATGVLRITDPRRVLTNGLDGVMQPLPGSGDLILSQLEVLKGRKVMGEVVDRELLRVSTTDRRLPVDSLRHLRIAVPSEQSRLVVLSFAREGYRALTSEGERQAAYGEPVELEGVRLAVTRHPGVREVAVRVGPREEAITELAAELRALPHDRTDAVDVQYTSTDPDLAQRVVNASMEAFQRASAQSSRDQSRRRRVFLQAQLRQTDSALAHMQVELSAFRSREQVYSAREKFTLQQQSLTGVEAELDRLVVGRSLYRSMLADLARERGSQSAVQQLAASELAANPVVAQLYGQLIQQQATRDSLTTGSLGVTAAHPDVQRLDALIDASQAKLTEAIGSHLVALDVRIEALEAVRARSTTEIAELPTTETEEVRLLQQVESTRRLGDELRTELQKARIAEAVESGPVEIVSAAPPPTVPLRGDRARLLGVSLFLGLLFGSGGAFLREHLNNSIRRRDDVEQVLRVPELAVIPKLGSSARRLPRFLRGGRDERRIERERGRLIAMEELQSAGSEAYRMLRTNLLFSHAISELRSLVITSAAPGEGKTTTAANLAVSFAMQGIRVLLVDCDLRRSRLHRLFDLPAAPGLSELALDQCTIEDAVRDTEVAGLSILPAGTLPGNPAELLGSPQMRRTMEALSGRFELLILDTPPLQAATDAAILSARSDGVALVVRAGQTDREAALYAAQQLRGIGARLVGAVLNDPDAKVPRYGSYYYYYDYYAPRG